MLGESARLRQDAEADAFGRARASSHHTMATFFFLDNSEALRARVAFLISRSRFGPSARKTAGQASFLEGVGLRLRWRGGGRRPCALLLKRRQLTTFFLEPKAANDLLVSLCRGG